MKNVQDGISRPLGSLEIQEIKVATVFRDTLYKTIDPGLGIKCLVYKMASLMSYVIYHTKLDIKGFVCIFVIADSLTKLLPVLFMIVLLPYYALFYSFNCNIHELFWLVILLS